jgi:hypothetical protein
VFSSAPIELHPLFRELRLTWAWLSIKVGVPGFQAILWWLENSAFRPIGGPASEAVVRGRHVAVTILAECSFRKDTDAPFQAECHSN